MPHSVQRRMQRLRSKLGYVRYGVTTRVASTISNIRDKSYAYAGFQTARPTGAGQDDAGDLCRARMQLRNTVVRALMVHEVTYEPSSRLKKSRKAVVLITGADLVLVKMTKSTSTARSTTHSASLAEDVSGLAGAPGSSTSAGSATAGPAGMSRAASRADSGLDAAAMVADARASVLAQHELNKMVRCEVCGDRLELEFIVTAGAEFKVSAAALGTTAASLSTRAASGVSIGAVGRPSGRLEEEVEDLETAITAAAKEAESSTRAASGSQAEGAHRSKSEPTLSPRSMDGSGAVSVSSLPDSTGAGTGSGLAAAAGAGSIPQQATSNSDSMDLGIDDSTGGLSFSSRVQQDPADRTGSRTAPEPLPGGYQGPTSMGSRTLGRWISRYSSTTSNGVHAVGSPPVLANGMSASLASGAGRPSFVRSLGSLTLGGTTEDASRSSFRPVKTDDGEYLVWVESFSLTFGDPSLAEMAADLLRMGRSNMRQALDWLKQGLPFKPEFTVSHITQLSSRSGDEVLRAGPTPWGTVLQLPDSWVEAVRAAQLPQDQPLNTPLEVPDGPAAFKVHLATPAGLAEATLLPELIAVLAQQPCAHGQVLAVPVRLMQQLTEATTEQQLEHMQSPATLFSSSPCTPVTSKQQLSVDTAQQGGSSSLQQQQQQQQHVPWASSSGTLEAPATAAAGKGMPLAAHKSGSASHKGLTWADQQQASSKDDFVLDAARHSSSSTGATGSTLGGSGSLTMQHSRSMPQLTQLDRLLPDTVAESDGTSLAGTAEHMQQLQQQELAEPRVQGSSSSLPNLQGSASSTAAAAPEGSSAAGSTSDLTASAAASAVDTTTAAAAGTSDGSKPLANSSSMPNLLRQQGSPQLAFGSEVHAVLNVRLLLDSQDPQGDGSCSIPALASVGTSGSFISPFATHQAPNVLSSDANPVLLSDGSLDAAHSIIQTPSVLLLGPQQPHRPTLRQQQALQAAVACVAALLCGLALLMLQTNAAAVLVLLATLLNATCMAVALQPAWFRGANRAMQRRLRLRHTLSSTHSSSQHHHHHGSQHHKHHLKQQHSKGRSGSGAAATRHSHRSTTDAEGGADGVQGSSTAGGPSGHQLQLQGLRLQLLGGSFVKEALGLLEQQINAYRNMQELQEASSVLGLSESDIDDDDLESISSESEDHEMFEVVFVSSPEPAWMTTDWRRRLWHARPTMEERCRLALNVHSWREAVGAGTILQQLPASFDWFQKHLVLRPLLKTQQGHLVVLLKLSTLSNMHRLLTAANLEPASLMRYCGFLWTWMFEEYARNDWPSGRFVLLADMSNLKLGQSVGEGQVGGRALGEVCNAYPERLLRCLVLGAPNWFNMLYRLIRPQLSPSTRTKVQVCTNRAEAVAELSCCLGSEWVPAEYGGSCSQPYDEYPAQKALLCHVAKLRQTSA